MSDIEIFVQSMFCFSTTMDKENPSKSDYDDWVERNNKKAEEIIHLCS